MTIALNNIKLRVLALSALAVCLIAPAALAAGDFKSVEVAHSEDGIRVDLAAGGDWEYRTFRIDGPPRFVVDLLGASKSFDQANFEGDGRYIRSIRTSQYAGGDSPVSRIVFDLNSASPVSVQRVGDRLVLSVGTVSSPAEQLDTVRNAGVASDENSLSLIGVAEDPSAFEGSRNTELVAADHWQDTSGLDAVASEERREDDASYARTMSINLQNADVRTILRSISDFSGRNIIAAPAVEGTVTVSLRDVPWREALAVILRANAFSFVEENGIIRVDTAEALRDEELLSKSADRRSDELEALVTRVVPIDFANAGEVKGAVENILTNRGSVQVDDRTNSLIVNDIPSSVDALALLARELDTRTPQVHIDALLVDLDSRASEEVGVDWGAFNIDAGTNLIGDASVTAPITEVAGQVRLGSVQDFGELRATVQALARKNVANIISNPRITTTDNREASILVGQKIPLITQDVSGNPITRLETIGIRLVVTPHINSDSQITLDIHPEVSDLSSQATVQGGVIINTSEADTRVLVGNRETAVIGGLIRRLETTFTSGVPVLKDIPLLGALFRSKSTNDEHRELLVFLTPTIVDERGIDVDREMNIREGVVREIESRNTGD